MPLFFRRRIVALGAVFDYSDWLTSNFPNADRWDHQDLPGSSVLEASYTTALALGRRLNGITYADYTAGAGWSNPSAELATHAGAGGTATLSQAGLLAVDKTYTIVTIISGRTAGSVIVTGTGAASMTVNDTYTDNITALGTALVYTPTDDFDGTVNCATVTAKQTNILASTAYAPGTNPMNGTTVAAQVGVPTNFGSLGLSVVDDGATSYSDIYSAEVNSKFNPAAGFVNIWAKASDFEDGNERLLVALGVDTNNFVILEKTTSNNQLAGIYKAAGTSETVFMPTSTTDYFMGTITWKFPGNVIGYLNGEPINTTAIANLLIGNLASDNVNIGAFKTTPSLVWDGSRTRVMLGYEAITPAQVLSIYNQGRR